MNVDRCVTRKNISDFGLVFHKEPPQYTPVVKSTGKGEKAKFRPITGHEGPEGE
jgi:hypothetical protein